MSHEVNKTVASENTYSIMESDTIQKNGASPKSLTDRMKKMQAILTMKNLNFALIISIMVMLGACKSPQKAAGYNGTQQKPTTVAQKEAADRGVKIQKEECEEMAMADSPNMRDAGNGISDREAFATNLALLDARSKLAQQLEVIVNGLIRNFNQQHEAGTSDLSSVAKAGQIEQGYFNQFLNNTKQICKNTYVKEDGRYNVYVCVEMDLNAQKAMHKKLTDDKMMQIDYQEYQFLQDMEKAKQDYQQKQSNQ